MGKILVIEGTDCSGKQTQSKMLEERLKKENINTKKMGFPVYDSPSGRIVGGPFLGKEQICKGWFPEKAPNVDWLVSSLYYAADRRYNLDKILELRDKSELLILDRYVISNLAHQCGKIFDREERKKAQALLEQLEYDILGLPRPDDVIFLHMPYEYAAIIKQSREEALDENESDERHLRNAEKAFLELVESNGYTCIECVEDGRIKTREEIHEEVYGRVRKLIKK